MQYLLPTLSLNSPKVLPQSLVEHPHPKQIKPRGHFLEWRHEVSEDADEEHAGPAVNLEHAEPLNVLQTGIDRHVQVVRVGHLQLLQLLLKLGVFLALPHDVTPRVTLQRQNLLSKIHRPLSRTLSRNYYWSRKHNPQRQSQKRITQANVDPKSYV